MSQPCQLCQSGYKGSDTVHSSAESMTLRAAAFLSLVKCALMTEPQCRSGENAYHDVDHCVDVSGLVGAECLVLSSRIADDSRSHMFRPSLIIVTLPED